MENEYKFQALLSGHEIEFPGDAPAEQIKLSPAQEAAIEKRFKEIRQNVSDGWRTKS